MKIKDIGSHHPERVLQPLAPYGVMREQPMYAFNPCQHNAIKAITERHCLGYNWPKAEIPVDAYLRLIQRFDKEGKLNGFTYNPSTTRKYLNAVRSRLSKYFRNAVVPGSGEFISEYLDHFESVVNNAWSGYKRGVKHPSTVPDYLARRGPEIISRYKKVAAEYDCDVISRKDTTGKMFLKYELYPQEKILKPARAIQFRGQKYTLNLARYLEVLDHQYFTKSKKYVPGEYIFSTKGLNSEQVADAIRRKFAGMVDPVYLGMDASRWDAHYTLPWLLVEHLFELMHFNHDPMLVEMLVAQTVNVFYSDLGLQYIFVGRRCSGDWTTSLGNNLTHAALQEWLMRDISAACLVDGDDNFCCVSEPDLPTYLARVRAEESGFEIKIEEQSYNISDIQYCQKRLCGDESYSRMVRSPRRLLSHLQNCLRTYTGDALSKYIYQIGMSVKAEFKGIPWFDSIGNWLQSNGKSTSKIHHDFKPLIARESRIRADWPNADSHIRAVWGDYPVFTPEPIPVDKASPYYWDEIWQ